MGTKLYTVLIDHRTISPEEIAAVARDMVEERVREIYEQGGEDGQPLPLEYDEQGQLKNPVSGLYLLVCPPHPRGLQMVWQESLDPYFAPFLDSHELARRLSIKAGKAFYIGYSSVSSSGTIWHYENGKLVAEVSNKREGRLKELDRVLGRHFKIRFYQLDRWVGEWYYLHPFNPLYAPHNRERVWSELLAKKYGKSLRELVEDYRAGRPLPEGIRFEAIKSESECWEAYDSRRYPSRMFELASGDLVRNIQGIVLKTPREVDPEWWFSEKEAHNEAEQALLEEQRARKYGPKLE